MKTITIEQLNSILVNFMTKINLVNPVCFPFFDVLLKTGIRPEELFRRENWLLNPDLSLTLRPLKRNNNRIISKESINDDFFDFLFNPDSIIPEISAKYLQRWFNVIMRRSFFVDTKPVTLYLFRYNYISNLFINPVDATPQNVITGHQSLAMTQRYYNSRIFELQPLIETRN